jgi:hypothetical protein
MTDAQQTIKHAMREAEIITGLLSALACCIDTADKQIDGPTLSWLVSELDTRHDQVTEALKGLGTLAA